MDHTYGRVYPVYDSAGSQHWSAWVPAKNIKALASFDGAYLDSLSDWFTNRYHIDGETVTMLLPGPGKYVCRIGSARNEHFGATPTGTSKAAGQFTHYLYVNAVDPANPEFRLINRLRELPK